MHNTGQLTNHGNSGTNDADIDAPEAWDITLGSSDVLIAVIDQGVTPDHPDLPNSRQLRINGSNIGARVDGTNADVPTPTGNDNHGNACAGIIAASHNNEGIAGIAPNCVIMPIRVAFGIGGNSSADFADAITFASDNGADIISNSWGGGAPSSAIEDAIANAIANGRNGRGVVVVFAAGNFRNNSASPSFPASANIDGLICVGASDRNDAQSAYSPSGDALDVVAPSHRAYNSQNSNESYEIWTIDIPGFAGYNMVNSGREDNLTAVGSTLPSSGTNFLSYTGRMGGTSSSCPQVAGVAALMLSENPCLTALEVESIIKRNADKVGSFNYNHNSNRPGHSDEMGFGRLNAYRCLTDIVYIQDETFTTSRNVVKSNGFIIVGNNVTSSLPQGDVLVTNGGSLYLVAGRGINIQDGFNAAIGSTFEAKILLNPKDCNDWDASFSLPSDRGEWIPDYNSRSQPNQASIFNNFSFVVYPNPATDAITVSFDKDLESNVDLFVLDLTGRTISTQRLAAGSKNHAVSLQNAAKGMYMISVVQGDNKTTKKVIVH